MSNRVGIAPSADRLKIVVRDATILVAAGALGLGLSGCTANTGVTAPTPGNATQIDTPTDDRGANDGEHEENNNVDPVVPQVGERIRAAGSCQKASIFDSLPENDQVAARQYSYDLQVARFSMAFTVAREVTPDAAGNTYRTYYCTADDGSVIVKRYTDNAVLDKKDPNRSKYVVYSQKGGNWTATEPMGADVFRDSKIGRDY